MDGVPAVMLLTGVLHYEGGNYTLASERFDRLLSLQPLNIKGRRLLGAAQYQAGNFSAAAQALQPLIERGDADRSEEHTSELQSLMRISYAVFCLKKKKK